MKIVNFNKKCSSRDVSIDDLASQLTLIDLSMFKSIKKDEILNLGYCGTKTTPKKQQLLPNVIAMNRQFNQVTFWVVGQIVHHESPRIRAQIVSHFIKTAKRLHHLNNLHSSYACISALLSSPIYRLERTWHFVKKKYPKDKLMFDELVEFYSDNNNYEILRNHLLTCSLPCIPYLGLYSRDMIYIKEAHPEGAEQRTNSVKKILNSIERFQSSQYNQLNYIPELNSLLLSCRYIDELQKFVEDDSYRRSLELEPPESLPSMPVDHNHNNRTNQNNNSSSQSDTDSGQSNQPATSRYKKSAFILASLTSIVQSAVTNTSGRFSSSSTQRRPSNEPRKEQIYLIDDSFINQKILTETA